MLVQGQKKNKKHAEKLAKGLYVPEAIIGIPAIGTHENLKLLFM